MTVPTLLAAGADANVQDEAGRTALHLAAMKGGTKAIAALINAGADLNVQDTDGRTPMHWAARRGHTKAVAVLMNAGADPNILDSARRRSAAPAAPPADGAEVVPACDLRGPPRRPRRGERHMRGSASEGSGAADPHAACHCPAGEGVRIGAKGVVTGGKSGLRASGGKGFAKKIAREAFVTGW